MSNIWTDGLKGSPADNNEYFIWPPVARNGTAYFRATAVADGWSLANGDTVLSVPYYAAVPANFARADSDALADGIGQLGWPDVNKDALAQRLGLEATTNDSGS